MSVPEAIGDVSDNRIVTLPAGLTAQQWIRERLLFAEEFFRELLRWNFKDVGAMWPTCAAVREAIFAQFPQGTETVVNVGAGTGVFERDIGMPKYRSHFAKLKQWIALEPHEPFADFFDETVHDRRVALHRKFASALPGIIPDGSADVVLTTVPKLEDDAQVEFCRTLYASVRPGGRYIHAIFRNMQDVMAKAAGVPRENIRVIPAGGQWLPPKKYLVQSIEKPAGTTAYSLPGDARIS